MVFSRRQQHIYYQLLCLFAVVAIPTVDSAPVFSTENGYDVGGNGALCWTSILPVSNSSQTDDRGSIETLNKELFDDGKDTKLLPRCFEGTSLTVEPLGNARDRQLFTGQPYTFRLTLESNLTAIDEDILVEALKGKSTIYARLQLCDAIKQGFCNPMWNSNGVDGFLKPADTDAEATESNEFSDNSTIKWKYKEGNTLLGLNNVDGGPGDTIVYSRWIRWTLKELEPNSTAYKTAVNITFQLPKGIRGGAYFFIGHAVMNFDLGDFMQRVDVAAAVPENVAEVQDPPKSLKVSNGMKISLGVAIGLFGLLALSMLVFLVYYRNHTVMKLAQASFLGAMTAACLMQIVCSFLFLPTKDIYCTLAGPLVLIPMTFMAACMVGRVWRVYSALSSIQSFGRIKPKKCNCSENIMAMLSFLANVPFLWTKKAAQVNRSKSFRQAVTAKQTASLICMLTLPQVTLQVLIAVLVPRKLVESLYAGGGDDVCDEDGAWSVVAGIGYSACVYLIAVVAAYIARNLPSAFNEKDQICQAAMISIVLAFISITLTEVVNDPTTQPDVQVFLRAVLSIGVAVCVLMIVVAPKILRVISGERVVMSTVFESRFGSVHSEAMSMTSSATAGSTDTETGKRIKFKGNEALPGRVESKILVAQNALRGATAKLEEGRPLSVEEVALLQQEIAGLNDELGLLDVREDNMFSI